MLADDPTEVRGLNVFRVNRVSVQRGAISKDRSQPRVVRTWQTKDVEAHGKRLDLFDDCSQTTKQHNVLFTDRLFNFRPVFPNNNMRQHS